MTLNQRVIKRNNGLLTLITNYTEKQHDLLITLISEIKKSYLKSKKLLGNKKIKFLKNMHVFVSEQKKFFMIKFIQLFNPPFNIGV